MRCATWSRTLRRNLGSMAVSISPHPPETMEQMHLPKITIAGLHRRMASVAKARPMHWVSVYLAQKVEKNADRGLYVHSIKGKLRMALRDSAYLLVHASQRMTAVEEVPYAALQPRGVASSIYVFPLPADPQVVH